MRLSANTLAGLPHDVARPAYSREQGFGIVHFGIGAFHRAHQAWYTDHCLRKGERDWMISGVSLRSATVRDQLLPQDGLYTLIERSNANEKMEVIGAVGEVLVAGPDRQAIINRIAAPDCRIASFTVTEKGYCRAADGSLDFDNAARGFYPIVGEALAIRMKQGLPGITLLSCDNLSGNGKQLHRLTAEWLASGNSDLAQWFGDECTAPETMVDRIVPATTGNDLARLAARLGMGDEGAVFTEPFSQWVVEDGFANGRPSWDHFGAQLVADVRPYETAKLRMLNGAHSLLAYCGLIAGHEFVHEAIADPRLNRLAKSLMAEAMATITPGPGQNLDRYCEELLHRFANSSLNHRLEQIAMDGSQKIPQRWLETLAERQDQGLASPSILTGIACWLRHIRGDAGKIDDPMADRLANAWAEHGKSVVFDRVFAAGGLISSPWTPNAESRTTVIAALDKNQI